MPEVNPELRYIGPDQWRRFVIIRNEIQPLAYWDGHGWTFERREASLYAHLDIAHEDLKEI